MLNTITQLKIGTRSSKLALKQTKLVLKKLQNLPQIKKNYSFKIIKIKTKGDIEKSKILRFGYKGFFTKTIDDLLLKKKIDLAVHSAKDIPSKIDNNISITAFLNREDPRDILLSKKNYTFDTIPENLTIGTSSIRRKTQIKNIRPDLKIKYMRGNIETRIKKLKKKQYDGIVLALAGIKRLGLNYKNKNILNSSIFIPAGGQGAIAVTTRKKDSIINNLIKKINNSKTESEIKIEREFLAKINADCDSPVGAYAKINNNYVNFSVTVPSHNGMFVYKSKTRFSKSNILGSKVANILKRELGKNFLKKIKFPKKFIFLLTRSIRQSNELKKKINLKNFNFINCPMLKIKPIKITKNEIKEIKTADALIFTSSNAVNISRKYLYSFSNKVFCVGDDTKTACLKNNIKNVFSSDGNVYDLIKLITKKIQSRSKKLVYISAKQTAVNLSLILKSKKFDVKKIIVYKAEKIKTIQRPILDLIKSNKINFVTFFSKKTAFAFNQLVLRYKLQKYLLRMECISLSNSIEKITKKNNFKKYYVSSNANRKSFLKLINSLHKII
tara:strand:- start:387 stop:2054 length:1668 start_codon:yes stop_codon:yes gene_type:complete